MEDQVKHRLELNLSKIIELPLVLGFDDVILIIFIVDFAHVTLTCFDVALAHSDALGRLLLIVVFFACFDNLELLLEVHHLWLDHSAAIRLLLHVNFNEMVFISDDVLHLVDVKEVDFAECLTAKVSLQADLVLTVKVCLQVMESPREELVWEALVITEPDLRHQR